MPIEAILLKNQSNKFKLCSRCKRNFNPFIRGTVQRNKRSIFTFKKREYCAIICRYCKEIIGWESPEFYRKSNVI